MKLDFCQSLRVVIMCLLLHQSRDISLQACFLEVLSWQGHHLPPSSLVSSAFPEPLNSHPRGRLHRTQHGHPLSRPWLQPPAKHPEAHLHCIRSGYTPSLHGSLHQMRPGQVWELACISHRLCMGAWRERPDWLIRPLASCRGSLLQGGTQGRMRSWPQQLMVSILLLPFVEGVSLRSSLFLL